MEPCATPVTTPVEATVAIPISLLLHVPPAVGSLRLVVNPIQNVVFPAMAEGNGFTVKLVAALQPVGSVYVINALPAKTPETTPEPEPTVAIPVLLLVHEPPPEASVNNVISPWHTYVLPAIADGSGFTVIGIVVMQPVGNV